MLRLIPSLNLFLNKSSQKSCIIISSSSCSTNSKNNPKNKSTSIASKKFKNRINILGTLGIASALLTSYLIVKRTYNNNNNNNNNANNIQSMQQSSSDEKNKLNFLSSSVTSKKKSDPKDEHLREQYNFIKKVVNNCAGAVFYLELRDPNIRDPETGQSVVISNGSGFIISEDGWALTNAHVVLNKPQSTITAIMKNGKSYDVKIEDADMNIDLALLKLNTEEKLPSLEFGESNDISVGEWVVALGSPLSLSNSVTVGIISSTDRPAEELGLKNYSMNYIQTDASITFGNSGGPLVNLDGNVIGINNLRLTSGISFAIPVEYAKKFLENSKFRLQDSSPNSGSKLGRILFGLTTISLTTDLLAELNRENRNFPKDIHHGLLVYKIIPGTPAYKSGLEVGDIITHINGIPIEKPIELYNFSSARNVLEMETINKVNKRKNIILHLN